jgi:hypothetical protein
MAAKVTQQHNNPEGKMTGIIPVWIIHGMNDTLVSHLFCNP